MNFDPVPFDINYVILDINQIPPEITKSEDLKVYVLLQTQGQSVEIVENPKIALSMFIFNILHSVCPEVVFRTTSGKKYSIYDHQSELAIRPKDVSDILTVKNDFNTTDPQVESVDINLENIWNSLHNTTLETKIVEAMPIIKNKIHRTHMTTLIGDVPLLFLLCAQHSVGHNSKQLFYQKGATSKRRRIK